MIIAELITDISLHPQIYFVTAMKITGLIIGYIAMCLGFCNIPTLIINSIQNTPFSLVPNLNFSFFQILFMYIIVKSQGRNKYIKLNFTIANQNRISAFLYNQLYILLYIKTVGLQ